MPIGIGTGTGGGGLVPVAPSSNGPSIQQLLAQYGPAAGNVGQATYARNYAGQLGAGAAPAINATATEVPGIGAQLAAPGAAGTGAAGTGGGFGGVLTGAQHGPAAPLTGIAGILSRQPLAAQGWAGVEAPLAGASTLSRVLAPGSIGRAGAYAVAGQLGSGLIRSALGGEKDGNWDNFAEDAAAYGGLGAGIGSFVPGIGTAIGAGAGVGVAAIKDFLFGGGSDSPATEAARLIHKQDADLNKILTSAGLSPEAAGQIRLQILTSNSGVTDPAAIKATYANAIQSIPAYAQQEQAQKQQLSSLLATQQMLNPQFDGFLKNLGADQQAFQSANNQFADQLGATNPAFAGYLKTTGANSVLSNDATAAAYKAQMGSQTQQLASQIGAPQSITDQLIKQYG